jgi:hypothetical protein
MASLSTTTTQTRLYSKTGRCISNKLSDAEFWGGAYDKSTSKYSRELSEPVPSWPTQIPREYNIWQKAIRLRTPPSLWHLSVASVQQMRHEIESLYTIPIDINLERLLNLRPRRYETHLCVVSRARWKWPGTPVLTERLVPEGWWFRLVLDTYELVFTNPTQLFYV